MSKWNWERGRDATHTFTCCNRIANIFDGNIMCRVWHSVDQRKNHSILWAVFMWFFRWSCSFTLGLALAPTLRIELVDTEFYIATLHCLYSGLIGGIHLTVCINISSSFALLPSSSMPCRHIYFAQLKDEILRQVFRTISHTILNQTRNTTPVLLFLFSHCLYLLLSVIFIIAIPCSDEEK